MWKLEGMSSSINALIERLVHIDLALMDQDRDRWLSLSVFLIVEPVIL